MKNAPIFSILVSTLLLFCSCMKKAEKELPTNNVKTFSDTVTMVFQTFQDQNLTSQFDTSNVIILYELNKTTITRDLNSARSSTVIHKSGNDYSIETESEKIKCAINRIENEFHNFGDLLVGSCWLESNGIPYADSGSKVVYSTVFGEVLFKGYQINAGQVIYSIDEFVVPISVRQELIDN